MEISGHKWSKKSIKVETLKRALQKDDAGRLVLVQYVIQGRVIRQNCSIS